MKTETKCPMRIDGAHIPMTVQVGDFKSACCGYCYERMDYAVANEAIAAHYRNR